jgi:hypothetical protein
VFRALRSCLMWVGLLVVVGIGVLVYRAMNQTRGPAQVALAPSPGAAQQGSAAPQAAALDARLSSAEAQIRQAAAAGQHTPVSFTITDPELTARVNQAISNGEVQLPISNVQVTTTPGLVTVRGQATSPIGAVPFTLTAVPKVASGKAQLQVTGVDFGGFPVPGPLANQLTSAVGSDNLLGDVPLTVTSFQAQQNQLVLSGTT